MPYPTTKKTLNFEEYFLLNYSLYHYLFFVYMYYMYRIFIIFLTTENNFKDD